MSRVVVVDVETTGLSVARGGRVIEIGAVAIEDGRTVAERSSLIDPRAPISASAFRVHGISPEMLIDQPSPIEVWPQLVKFFGDSCLVAHNAAFDVGFIRQELGLLGLRLKRRRRGRT